ncbi:hypothetical protein [Phenylobacterium sp.]|uniref:ORC-CDC6 family AAA ATPase n=1 Tax=Phenylobacterium sp. TaxID=1871053 RepID=UPI00272F816E|nr:hypothetical protein [Phenylobacterium sp.]MDP1619358.1 hypothetical protein [Phenylobacterium sp.]MDP1987481.1 hypothetical protein [Phenylobacterium sp.]
MASKSDVDGLEDPGEGVELPLDANFIEQAEYIDEDAFLALSAVHPDEESIVRRLSVGGAKLLVGPRGCGKTTLMMKAYYGLLRQPATNTLPVYVNFKLSLKLEPLYINTPNATYWFRLWLNLKIYQGIFSAISISDGYNLPDDIPSADHVGQLINGLEAGRVEAGQQADAYTVEGLSDTISRVLAANGLSRCVLLLDDAAHAFSPRQQEDFFEFFRQIKSREISPKAAVYPGITTHSPTFHVGHDAEQIDVWVKPDRQGYVEFMRSLAIKRFNGSLPRSLDATPDALEFLAYASFGIPRSFLNMLRTIYHEDTKSSPSASGIDRRKLLDIAKQSRELSHNVYDSLANKLPAYKQFVDTGRAVYQRILMSVKEFNRGKEDDNQALEIGLKRPVPAEIEKVFSFFQYAGLLMPSGDNSRGEKGVFDLYMVHFGDLVTENAIIGRRAKSVPSFVKAFKAQTHQAWPRISPDSLVKPELYSERFRLSLPHCQNCGAERASEQARFCQNCGAQLKTSSLYDELTNQPISVLPISQRMQVRIAESSNIRTIKDILIDSERTNLRSIPQIGPVRAARFANYAEEYVA